MLKKAASREKAEVQAKVEDKIKNIRSSLNLDLSLPSLAAALLNGLFEHPACVVSREELDRCWRFQLSCSIFFADFPISLEPYGSGTNSTRLDSIEHQYGKEASIHLTFGN
jgi:hypothetical protein